MAAKIEKPEIILKLPNIPKAEIGMAETMFGAGLLLLFSGLWLLVSLGLALTVSGGLLVTVSVLSSWYASQPPAITRPDA